MRKTLLTALLALLLPGAVVLVQACRSDSSAPPESDAGFEEEEVDYEGPGSTGVIPDEIPEEEPVGDEGDAGEFFEDTTCCTVTFAIPDHEEPPEAIGRVRGYAGPLLGEGLAMARGNGTWTATACMPVNSATRYWYELSWPDASSDAGAPASEVDASLPDGETPGPGMVVEIRIAEDQPKEYDGNGNQVNFHSSGATCTDTGS